MTAYAWSYSPVRPPRSGQAVYEHNRSGSLSPIVLTDRHYARSPARRTGQHYQGFRVVQSATNQHSRSAHSISTFDQHIRSAHSISTANAILCGSPTESPQCSHASSDRCPEEHCGTPSCPPNSFKARCDSPTKSWYSGTHLRRGRQNAAATRSIRQPRRCDVT